MRNKIFKISILSLFLTFFSHHAFCQLNDFEEFQRGERIKYFTKEHSKAKGINISIEYPQSWTASEGERPSIVQKFSADASDGRTKGCIILIKDMPKNLSTIPNEEISKEAFSEQSLKDMIPPGATFVNGQPTKYDGQPGAWIVYSIDMERAGMTVRMHTLQQIFIYKGKMIIIQCSVGGLLQPDDGLNSLFVQYLPLFQQIGNSVIIYDKWENDKISSSESPLKILYGTTWWLTLIVSFLLTWGIGLIPSLLIRYLIVKKPLSKMWAISLVIVFWIINFIIFTALGSQSRTHVALFLVAWVSYIILRKTKSK